MDNIGTNYTKPFLEEGDLDMVSPDPSSLLHSSTATVWNVILKTSGSLMRLRTVACGVEGSCPLPLPFSQAENVLNTPNRAPKLHK